MVEFYESVYHTFYCLETIHYARRIIEFMPMGTHRFTLVSTHATTDGGNWVERFIQWCGEAERSGIKLLQDFADLLRGYTRQTA